MTEAQPAQTTEINDGLHRTNVAVFGLDRPGIVAVVSNALTRRGVNLEQVNQMALHGQFALMCVIQKPAGLSNEQIQQELEAEIARRKFDLAVMVIDFKAPTPQPESEPYVVSVWGTDRNDIIANFSRIFAEQKITSNPCVLSRLRTACRCRSLKFLFRSMLIAARCTAS